MTTVDMDRASIDLATAATDIAERYGLAASALFYVIKGLEAQVAEARVTELLTAPQPTEDKPQETAPETEEVKTFKRQHASMEAVKEIIAEKIAAGDVDENGKAHCSMREAAERTAQHDSTGD